MKKIDNYFITSNNLAKSKHFYESILGLKLKFDFEDKGMIAFSVGNDEPAIIVKDINKFPNAKSCIWFEVDDVLDTYNELREKGIIFLSEPYKIGSGMAVEFMDQDNNLIGITDYK